MSDESELNLGVDHEQSKRLVLHWYKRFTALTAEFERLDKRAQLDIGMRNAENAKLRAALEGARDALAIYADETRWATGFGGTEVFNCEFPDKQFGCDVAKSELAKITEALKGTP